MLCASPIGCDFALVALLDRHLVLRTRNPEHVPELLALTHGQTSADVIVGRVFRDNCRIILFVGR